MLPKMNLVDGRCRSDQRVRRLHQLRDSGRGARRTYDHPSGLAKDVNKPGSAEGGQAETDELDDVENHRHQTYEPVPLGIAIENPDGSDAFNSPVWYVEANLRSQTRGETPSEPRTTSPTSRSARSSTRVAVSWIGGLLPDPSEKFDHPFGLSNYALTYSGYQLIQNVCHTRGREKQGTQKRADLWARPLLRCLALSSAHPVR